MSNDLTVYQKWAPMMQSMDCLSYASNSMLGRIIRWFSPGSNHIGLVLRLPQWEGKENRRWTLQANAPGIELNLLSKQVGKYDGHAWLYQLKDEYGPLRDIATEWALCQVGVKYDFGGLIKNVVGRVNISFKELFCSEYAYLAWAEAGIVPKVDKAPILSDIIRLSIFKDPIQLV